MKLLYSIARMSLVFTVMALLSWPTLAQSPNASAAQSAARAFLILTDRDDGKASWNEAGKLFQEAITSERWSQALHGVRAPLGATKTRTLESTEFTDAFPGVKRNGSYAILTFRTQFATGERTETVTLEREADGMWHVIGYVIR